MDRSITSIRATVAEAAKRRREKLTGSGAGRDRGRVLWSRPEFIYSGCLFIAAVIAVGFAIARSAAPFALQPPPVALFFYLYGLFTISAGYEHPRVGYVSFDRVAQIGSILVLGPVDAAWVNGLASFTFPWRRLREGVEPGRVLTAALNNAGLMTLMILASGTLYVTLGGAVPLLEMSAKTGMLVLLLITGMQAINELGMGIHFQLRDGHKQLHVSGFVLALEIGSGLTAVVLAIVYGRLEPSVTLLLLIVLSAGMLVLRQFARMRIELEAIVAERTHVLREKTIELEKLATRDQLTGLYNRRFVDAYLESRIEEFHRYGRGFSIALMDLDHFKRINDEKSHEVGDLVLQRVARILSDRCRQTDVVARYGGEEFLLCFPEADGARVVDICEQLRRALADNDWSDVAPDLKVSMSAGVAEMQPGLSRRELVRAADRKLYEAKNAGRDLVLW